MIKSAAQCLVLLSLFMAGCQSAPAPATAEPALPALSTEEKKLCDSFQMDSQVVGLIRKYTFADLTKAPDSLRGITFHTKDMTTALLMQGLRNTFQAKGYSLFVLDQGFGKETDIMAILKTPDKYAVLKQVQTNAANYSMDTDSLIKVIKGMDERYELTLMGAGEDWCEFSIGKDPEDWMEFAKEVYKFCPDDVDQGTQTVEELAKEMRQSRRLYFWWD